MITAVGMTTSPVAEAAPPTNASDAAKQVRNLSRDTEKLTEDYKKAQDDHNAKQAALDRANAQADQAQRVADQARAEETKFRGRVDRFAGASFEGARMNKLSALLTSTSPHDFLDRSSALDALAQDNNEALHHLGNARSQAESAEQRAQSARTQAARAEADSARLQDEIGRKRAALQKQIAGLKQKYASLSQQEKDSISGGGSTSAGPIAGSGAAIQAVNYALAQQGKPYVYGSKGPSSFDCSGLVQSAYEKAGVSLPASTQSQKKVGRSVSPSNMKPGDIVFFYSSQSHDGLYIGNGKVVHAPTEGQDVKVSTVQYVGKVTKVRRVAG